MKTALASLSGCADFGFWIEGVAPGFIGAGYAHLTTKRSEPHNRSRNMLNPKSKI
jgi:hypothetical protein